MKPRSSAEGLFSNLFKACHSGNCTIAFPLDLSLILFKLKMATDIASDIENIMNKTETLLLFYIDSLFKKQTNKLNRSFSDFSSLKKDNLESGYTLTLHH